MKNNFLYLGSRSISRQRLLTESLIPFVVVPQDADEKVCSLNDSLESLVTAIAIQKMEHAVVPADEQAEHFVLTADTMVRDSRGNVFGKPFDRNEAVMMIKAARDGMKLATAFCLERRVGILVDRVIKVCVAEYAIDIPDHLINWSLDNSIGMQCAGAFAMEGVGLQFLKCLDGSFSNLMGLPLYELRCELVLMNFFD